MTMITELLLAELDRGMVGTREPHEKSMPLGYLAGLVATMPAGACRA